VSSAPHTPLHETSGHGLDVRAILRLAFRTLPYLGPILRQLRPALLLLPLLPFFVIGGLLAADLVSNRLLAGNPLTPFEATLLSLPTAEFVEVDALSVSARNILRDRLVRDAFIVLAVVLPLIAWLSYLVIGILQRINQTLRVQMIENLHAQSLRFHQGSRIGDAVYRTFQDSAMVTSLMAMLVRPIGPLIGALIGLGICALFDWRLAASLVVVYYAVYRFALFVTPKLRRDFRVARERNSALTSRIQESLAGVAVIKAYGAEGFEQERFEEASRDAFAGAFRARTRLALLGVLSFMLTALPGLFATGVVALLANRGEPLAAGAALAFIGFAQWNLGAYLAASDRTIGSARAADWLFRMWAQAQDMGIGMERAFSQVDLAAEVQDAPDAQDLAPVRKGVAFRDVRFGYRRDHPVLDGIDLEARVGEVTALVGPTGSGKSTLVSLLLRLFDPDDGTIEIDGVDLRALRLESLRSQVGIALQEHILFGTTIQENIRYAVPTASDEQVREAARVACAEEFILEQPQGYETPLGERGARLSTGQRQRLSIARAVIKNTPVLVLDEPTAALDAATELRVMRNLATWGRGRVILIVTHRLSTIRRADQIVYLRDGHIVERGAHADLVASGGRYARFVELESA
jgi:ABC-type multidrug transport system fused ATPase/permease subunit